MAQEPIMWVRPTGNGYQPPRFVRPGPDGEPVIEKVPATAPPPDDHPLHGQPVRRWELMVDDCGNTIRTVYTGGAADYQVDHPQYGAELKRRHRARGWFPLGACPLVLARAGQLEPRFLHAAIRGAAPCAAGTYSARRPCEHALAEEAHRKDRNRKREAARAEAFKPEAERMMKQSQDLQKQGIDLQQQTLSTLVDTIKALIGGGGQWPMARPNLTEEEYLAELAARAKTRGPAPAAGPGDPSGAPSEEELADLLLKADELDDAVLAEPAPEPEPPSDKGKGRKGR